MAKRLYSIVVSSGTSGDESPTASPPLFYINEYQVEEEHVALKKALNLSKVCELKSCIIYILAKVR